MTVRILFVDDDANLLRGLRRALGGLRNECELVFVDCGAKALEVFRQQPFDVVVSDIRMPQLDGARLLSEVKKCAPGTVRIALSGQTGMGSVLRVLGTAHQYLTKPCTSETLLDAITGSLRLRTLLRSPSLRALVAGLHTLPSLPKVYFELLEELESPLTSVSSVAKIIARDVAMVVEILRPMNSAYFALPSRVTTIRQAINLLGFETITALVLKEGIFRQLRGNGASASVIEEIYRRSHDIAVSARSIAKSENLDPRAVDEAFCAGMLCKVGTMVLVDNFRAKYMEVLSLASDGRVSIAAAEGRVFGATHAEVGGYLLSLWGFHDPIVKAVAYQHHPHRSSTRDVTALTVVHVAQAIAAIDQADDISEEALSEHFDEAYLKEVGVADRVPLWLDMVRAERREAAAEAV